MKITKGLTWPFLLFTFASLMVFLGGLAYLQHTCFTPTAPTVNTAFNLPSDICRRTFRFQWFSFAFVLATLIGMMITTAVGAGLHYSRPFWIGMLAVCTVLMMIMSETFTGIHYLGDGSWFSSLSAILAGAIMTVVGLVLLMMAIGTDWEQRRGHGNHDKTPSGIAGVAVPVQNVRVEERV